jgi:hypothetical protein
VQALRAMVLIRSGFREEAVGLAQEVLRTRPTEHGVVHALGEVFRQSDDLGYYIQTFDQAAADKPDDVMVRVRCGAPQGGVCGACCVRGALAVWSGLVTHTDSLARVLATHAATSPTRSWAASCALRGCAWRITASCSRCVEGGGQGVVTPIGILRHHPPRTSPHPQPAAPPLQSALRLAKLTGKPEYYAWAALALHAQASQPQGAW